MVRRATVSRVGRSVGLFHMASNYRSNERLDDNHRNLQSPIGSEVFIIPLRFATVFERLPSVELVSKGEHSTEYLRGCTLMRVAR